jgi:hypothetical protein
MNSYDQNSVEIELHHRSKYVCENDVDFDLTLMSRIEKADHGIGRESLEDGFARIRANFNSWWEEEGKYATQ